MTVSYVGTFSISGNATAIQGSFTLLPGDLLLGFALNSANVLITPPTGFSPLITTQGQIVVFYHFYKTGDPTSYTFTALSGTTYATVVVYRAASLWMTDHSAPGTRSGSNYLISSPAISYPNAFGVLASSSQTSSLGTPSALTYRNGTGVPVYDTAGVVSGAFPSYGFQSLQSTDTVTVVTLYPTTSSIIMVV